MSSEISRLTFCQFFLSHTGNYSGLFSFNTDCTDQHRVFIRLICAIRVHYSAVLKVDPLVCRANPLQQAQSPEEATDNIVMLWLDNATHPGLSMLDGATHPGLSMLDGATHPRLSMLDGSTHPGLSMLDGATHPGLSMFDNATHPGLSMLDGATHPGL